jgi:hypothetical protein
MSIVEYNPGAVHVRAKCGEQFKAQTTPEALAAGPKN